jgi:outer membrane protein OmpA-like peptidoglycan-associated protein
MMNKTAIGAALLLLGVTVATSAARAQSVAQPTFDIEELTLDPAAVDSLVVVGGRTLPEGGLRLGFALGYERNPLTVTVNGSSVGALVSDRVTGDLIAAYGITDRLEITADIPGVLYQRGDDLSAYGLSAVEADGLSNPLVGLRYGIVKDSSFNLAAALTLGLPFGSTVALGGQGADGFSVEPQVAATWLGGPMLIAAEVGALLRDTSPLDVRNIGSELDAAASVEVATWSWRPELILHFVAPLTQNVPVGGEGLLGVRHDLGTPEVEAFALAGGGVGELPGLPAFRALLGIAWRPDLGKKPAEPAPCCNAPPPPPPPPVAVECPAVPECPKPVAAVDPCAPGQAHTPYQCPDLDDDGDGILNKDDRCPLEKGPESNQGCPIQDRDHDGIADADDLCPDEPGPASNLGCPVKDTDLDGVPDVIDNCPLVPGPAENNGCPVDKPQKVYVQREVVSRIRSRLKLKVAVNFATNRAVIGRDSYALLDQMADLLAAHPELKQLRVEGHTDSTGSAERNRVLSAERAQAVRDYLEQHGVEKGRLTAQGFGPSRPIDSNETVAGRARNRRVEIAEVEVGE